MLTVDNVTPSVVAKLLGTANEPRLWTMEGVFPEFVPHQKRDSYSGRFEGALRREVVAQARGCLQELPELEGILLRADHGRRGLLVTRESVKLVHGYMSSGLARLWNAPKINGTVPEEVLT